MDGKSPENRVDRTRKTILLVVRMMEYRLQSMETLENEIRGETERLHRRRDPKKIRASYRRLRSLTDTVGELAKDDHFDAYHLRILIDSVREHGTEMPCRQGEPDCPCYIK